MLLRTAFVSCLLLGCLDPEPGHFACDESRGCPDGWSCHSDDRCYPDEEGPVDMRVETDAAVDMPVGETDGSTDACVPRSQRPVDLLLVVDNSNSMVEEQERLKASVRGLLEALTLGRNAAGELGAFAPVEDLHVGVITTDIGADDAMLPGGVCPGEGDDGVLLRQPRAGSATCPEAFENRYLSYDPSTGVNALADDLACLASVGLTGCGFEQQLESMARALVPSTLDAVPRGKIDGPNDGFLREGSVLIVSIVTDESDCSASDSELFVPDSGTYGHVGLNLRCGEFADTALHSIGRYADVLLTHVRGRRDTDVVYAPLVGVPPELVGESWDAILADESQSFRTDPADTTQYLSSCESAGTKAFPAPRFVELAKRLEAQGGHATLGSICDTDYGSYFDGILTELETLLFTETCE